MKNYLLLLLMLVTCLQLKSQENTTGSHTFTLEQCIQFAFNKNYDRQSLDLARQAQELSYKQSKLERYPSVQASVGESMSNSNSINYSTADGAQYNTSDGVTFSGNANLSVGATLYNGGSINKTIEQNQLNLQKAENQISVYDDELVVKILQAFLSVLSNEEQLKYQEFVLNTSRSQVEQGKVQYEAGAILVSDYLLLKAQYAGDSNNIVDTRISHANNLLSLKILLSMEPTDELSIIYPDTASFVQLTVFPSQDEVLESALNYLPSIKSSLFDIDLAKTAVSISKASLYPSININGGIGTGHTGFNDFGTQLSGRFNQQLGVSVSVPIFNSFSARTRVAQSQISLKQAQLDYEQNLLTIRQTVVQEYQNLVSSYNKYLVSEITKEAYLKSFEAYNVQFEHGSITAVDLLQQQNSYINAMNEYIRSKYSFMLQRKIMDVYMGKAVTM